MLSRNLSAVPESEETRRAIKRAMANGIEHFNRSGKMLTTVDEILGTMHSEGRVKTVYPADWYVW
jgi:hypothetical protein